jgi:hypothetical protein
MDKEKRGDPTGRRLAQRRASVLAEAGMVARQLEVLLDRAEFDTSDCRKIIEDLAVAEQGQLLKAHGRIESRNRFKKKLSGHPLLDDRLKNVLFVDESGKALPHRLAPSFAPAFAVGAVAMQEEDVASYCSAADEIKMEFFGRTDFNFHEPDMRNYDGRYHLDGDEKRRSEFDRALDGLVRETGFVAFGVGVRKDAFEKEFVDTGVDPYLATDVYAVAILMLIERYVDFLAFGEDPRFGRVNFESQGPREDAQHQLEYARVLVEGSQWVSEAAFRHWLAPGVQFTPKVGGSEPMELADMMSRDLFEWVRGGCTGTPKRWELFSDKIYCRGDGGRGKFGVKVFPDSGVRELIEAHRIRCGAAA